MRRGIEGRFARHRLSELVDTIYRIVWKLCALFCDWARKVLAIFEVD